MTTLLDALLLSLKIALVATLLVTLLAVPLAYAMARRSFRGKSLIEALLVVPLVLPPTVVGYFLLVLCGTRSPLGAALLRRLGYTLLFNWHGAVLAAAAVSLPLLYLPAKAGFAGVERELEDVARLFGAGPARTFWHVSLPLARRGIGSGLLLAFARALGEFGATVMVMGSQPGRQTLPILIYDRYVTGEMTSAAPAVVLLACVSFAVIVLYNRSIFAGGQERG
jgi:molybdate transport system permease protein